MADDKKPWGDDFDEERAWALIQGLRSDKADLKRERDEARQERDDATTAKDAAEKDAGKARKALSTYERTAILKEFSIDEDDAKEFLPEGLSTDELRRKAERLAKRNAKSDDSKDDEKDKGQESETDSKDDEGDDSASDKGDLPGRPKPALSPGSGGEPSAGALDLDAIAEATRRR